MLRILLIPLALIALLIGAMFWSGGGQIGRAEFAYIDNGDIITLDPNQISYSRDFRITYAIREGLYAYNPSTLIPEPADATSVDITPDKKTWTFHLRPEAKWTNGDPVRAADYIFAWRRMLEEPGEYTYLFYYLENAKAYEDAFAAHGSMSFDQVGVKALDPLTLRVTLHDPCGFFLDLVSFTPFYPLNERSMQRFAEANNGHVSYKPEFTKPQNVVTNGPFYLKRWDFKRDLWLEKSPSYWDHKHVPLKSIEMVINDDPLSSLLMYESGSVDWVTDVNNDFCAELRARGRKDLIISPGFGTFFMDFNCASAVPGLIANNPLADVRVRQAIDMAIDKQQICDTILMGLGEKPATTFIPPNIFHGYHTTPGFNFDVTRARKLLADAGYPNGAGFPTLPLLFPSTAPQTSDLVQDIKNQLQANLNITVDLQSMESRIYSTRIHDKQFVLGVNDWIGDYGDPSTFTDKYLSTSANNPTNWLEPQYDKLCGEAAHESDNAKRMALLEQAENLINTEVPIVPLYFMINTDLCRPYVDMHFNPRMTISFKGIKVHKH
ncbi:MAG TPA: peptide ABC transporter substrate-binding protein [Tepidisphaeraceae bacterium]|jgi:oligopeptide transport system substrate-binding protein